MVISGLRQATALAQAQFSRSWLFFPLHSSILSTLEAGRSDGGFFLGLTSQSRMVRPGERDDKEEFFASIFKRDLALVFL